MERAIASSGLKHLPSIDTVIGRLVVTRPDPTARILQISYNAATRDEAFQVVRAVVDSYGEFLRSENWENSNGAITMIIKARNELNEELKQLEREYLEFHSKNPAYATDERGRTLVARRLEQWDQVANQVQLRSLQFQSQLELGRNLVSGGAGLRHRHQRAGSLERDWWRCPGGSTSSQSGQCLCRLHRAAQRGIDPSRVRATSRPSVFSSNSGLQR